MVVNRAYMAAARPNYNGGWEAGAGQLVHGGSTSVAMHPSKYCGICRHSFRARKDTELDVPWAGAK